MNATCQGNLSVFHRFATPDSLFSRNWGFFSHGQSDWGMKQTTRPLPSTKSWSCTSTLPCHDIHRDISPKHDLFQAALLLNNASCGSKFMNNDSTNTSPFSYNIYVSYPSNGFCTQAWLNSIREYVEIKCQLDATDDFCCCPQTGHITLSSTPYRQLENQSTKYHMQQPSV